MDVKIHLRLPWLPIRFVVLEQVNDTSSVIRFFFTSISGFPVASLFIAHEAGFGVSGVERVSCSRWLSLGVKSAIRSLRLVILTPSTEKFLCTWKPRTPPRTKVATRNRHHAVRQMTLPIPLSIKRFHFPCDSPSAQYFYSLLVHPSNATHPAFNADSNPTPDPGFYCSSFRFYFFPVLSFRYSTRF